MILLATAALAALEALAVAPSSALRAGVGLGATHIAQPPSLVATAAAAAAAASAPPPALFILGDSVDGYAVTLWCRHHAMNLCFDRRHWAGYNAALPGDDCAAFDEALASLAEPWVRNLGFLACHERGVGGGNSSSGVRNSADGRNSSSGGRSAADARSSEFGAAASIVFVYNLWGASNNRPPQVQPAPASDLPLAVVWDEPFRLVPRLLRAPPSGILVQSLFWDLQSAHIAAGGEAGYSALTDVNSSASTSFVAAYSAAVGGPLLDMIEELTGDWPLTLRVWRTANLVNEAGSGKNPWRHGANALIRRMNAAAVRAVASSGYAIFDFEHFANSSVLRDEHHPTDEPMIAAIEAVLADARRAAATAAAAASTLAQR